MQSNWDLAPVLFDIDELADLLGERHRIIANNWQSASVMTLVGHVLDRAVDLLDHIDFTPTSLRADLAGPAVSTQHVYAAAEMIDHASDLLGHSRPWSTTTNADGASSTPAFKKSSTTRRCPRSTDLQAAEVSTPSARVSESFIASDYLHGVQASSHKERPGRADLASQTEHLRRAVTFASVRRRREAQAQTTGRPKAEPCSTSA